MRAGALAIAATATTVVVVGGLLVTGAWNPGGVKTALPTPTATPSASASTGVGATASPPVVASPTITTSPTPEAVPTPAATVALPVDPAGSPPAEAQPAAALVAVTFAELPAGLDVTWDLAGDVPSSARSLLWSVDLYAGETLARTVTVQLVGARLFAGVFDWEQQAQTVLEDPRVAGASVAITVPNAALGGFAPPFQWEGLTQLDGAFEARLPAGGRGTYP